MKSLNYILLLLIMVAFWSCKKESDPGDCFKAAGMSVEEEREIGAFRNVVLNDNVNLVLRNGNSNKIIVEAGKNLLPKIKTEVNENGDLVISNENRCNWVRSYKHPVIVYLEFSRIDTLFYASIGDVVNNQESDTLYFEENFCLQIDEGAGDIKLNIVTGFLRLAFTYGICDVDLSGRVGTISVYSSAWGLIDLTGVDCKTIWAINNSSNDMHLYCTNELQASTEALGDIYIAGHPPNINFDRQGEGDLIIVP